MSARVLRLSAVGMLAWAAFVAGVTWLLIVMGSGVVEMAEQGAV